MALYLYETVPNEADKQDPGALVARLGEALTAAGAEVIESQVTRGAAHVFTVAEVADGAPAPELAGAVGAASVSAPAQVRVVGADLADIKAARPEAGYLVEWDLPAEIDMESYLTRKKANAPKYADVPEVSFLRTYVREDTLKCLCFYDAPDEDAVVRARDAVSTPITRLHELV
ncbi:DUF4242 domain-containing protein [Georgenia yuyongxinii]